MTLTNTFRYLLIAVLILFGSYLIISQSLIAKASAPSGLTASVATTSNPTVTTTAATVFATSTNCAARVVTTVASPVMMTFSDYAGQTPTATFGHLQLASTTVVYDAGIYGCGLVKMFGFVSSAITVTETR